MRRKSRVVAFGTLATILSVLSLIPVFVGAGWFWRSLGAIVVVVVVGEVVRRGLRVWVAPIAQLLALIGYVTVLFARDEALLDVLPGPAALERLREVAGAGMAELARSAPPVPEQSAIVAVAVGGIGLVALLVDVFVGTLGRAAVAGFTAVDLVCHSCRSNGRGSPGAVRVCRDRVSRIVAGRQARSRPPVGELRAVGPWKRANADPSDASRCDGAIGAPDWRRGVGRRADRAGTPSGRRRRGVA